VFKQSITRFPDAATPFPGPCEYQHLGPIVAGPAHTLSSPFEADKDRYWQKRNPPIPGPGAYDISKNRKKNRAASPAYASRIERLPGVFSEGPPVGSYNPMIGIDGRIPTVIKGKDERGQSSIDESPSPACYTVKKSKKIKGGIMNTRAHQCYPVSDDQKLAFCTQHSNFIKRTYSRKYFHVNREVC
jgi:hypothetical protein